MEPDKTRMILAAFIIIGFLAVIGAWFVFPVKGDMGLFNVLAGMLGSGFMGVVGYYFGSSAGSKTKDAALVSLAGANTVTPVPSNITTLGKTGS